MASFGDAILVPFPFTDQSGGKRRPAVVVSSAGYHAEHRDVVIMAITSRVRPDAAFGETVVQRWESAGLLRRSSIKPIITTIERRLVLRKLGELREGDASRLRESLDRILG